MLISHKTALSCEYSEAVLVSLSPSSNLRIGFIHLMLMVQFRRRTKMRVSNGYSRKVLYKNGYDFCHSRLSLSQIRCFAAVDIPPLQLLACPYPHQKLFQRYTDFHQISFTCRIYKKHRLQIFTSSVIVSVPGFLQ